MKPFCTRCGVEKPLTGVSTWYDYANLYLSQCKKDCGRTAKVLRQKLWKYGLTPEQYDKMLTDSGGRCAICGESFEDIPYIDHCHSTGNVRGLLCRQCNRGLGCFKDSAENLSMAVEYLNNARRN